MKTGKNYWKRSIAGLIAFAMIISCMAAGTFAAEPVTPEDGGDGIFIDISSEIPEGYTLVLPEKEETLSLSEYEGSELVHSDDPYGFVDEESQMALLEAGEGFPTSFDQRSVDTDGDGEGDACFVTPVKLQNPFGTCWGFAAISAAETSILGSVLKEDVIENGGTLDLDLSEKQLAYYAHKFIEDRSNPQNGEGTHNDSASGMGAIYTGGTTYLATSTFAQGIGPVYEYIGPDMEEEMEILRYHGNEKNIDYRYFYSPEKGEYGFYPFSYSDEDDWLMPEDYRFMQSFVLNESSILPSPAGKDTLGNYVYNEAATAAIKGELLELRGVEIGFCADTSQPNDEGEANYLNQNTWAHYTWNTQESLNHAVQIIGWDDDYPKENFNSSHQPPADGAWLVKNSWGSGEEEFPNFGNGSWGIQKTVTDSKGNEISIGTGYFWISYYDTSIGTVESFNFDKFTPFDGYYLDQYDLMQVTFMEQTSSEDDISMANVFKAEASKELEAVSFVTTTPGTEVHVEVYLLKNGAVSPKDGLLAASTDTGSYEFGGFHKIYLNDFKYVNDFALQTSKDTGNLVLPVQKNQSYSIIVTQKLPDSGYALTVPTGIGKESPVTQILEGSYQVGVINEGESFAYYSDEWVDISDKEKWQELFGFDKDNIELRDLQVDNFPIKGFCNVKSVDSDIWLKPSERVRLFMYEGQDNGVINLRFSGKAGSELAGREINWQVAKGGEDIIELIPAKNGAMVKAKKTGETEVYVSVEGVGCAIVPVTVGVLYATSILFPDNNFFTYTGEAIEPQVYVSDSSGMLLAEGTDYSLKYENNINVGIASVTADIKEGLQNPDSPGPLKTYFVISPPKLEVKGIEAGETSVTITVEDQSALGITGYAVQATEVTADGKGDHKETFFEPGSNKLVFEGLKAETEYQFLVISVVLVPEDIIAVTGLEEFYPSQDPVTVSAATTSHKWGEPVYTWADDNSTVTAKRVCEYDESHVEEETAAATGKVTKEATESGEGEEVFTASFTNPVFEAQTKTVVIPKKETVPTKDLPYNDSFDSTGIFPDVADAASPVFKPVYWAVDRGIIKGYANGYFGPEDSCTRAQFTIMLWRFAGKPAASGKVNFSDVTTATAGYSAIQWAVEQGIIKGFSDNTFRPDDTVTRRQVAVMLWRYQGKPEAEKATSFTDVKSTESTYKAIQWGAEAGLIKGYSDKTFRPEDNCLRQHIVIFLYRFARDVQGEDVR